MVVFETRCATSLTVSLAGGLRFLSISLLLLFVDVLGVVSSVFTSA